MTRTRLDLWIHGDGFGLRDKHVHIVTGVIVGRDSFVFLALIQWTMRLSNLLLQLGCESIVRSRWECSWITSRQRRNRRYCFSLVRLSQNIGIGPFLERHIHP